MSRINMTSTSFTNQDIELYRTAVYAAGQTMERGIYGILLNFQTGEVSEAHADQVYDVRWEYIYSVPSLFTIGTRVATNDGLVGTITETLCHNNAWYVVRLDDVSLMHAIYFETQLKNCN